MIYQKIIKLIKQLFQKGVKMKKPHLIKHIPEFIYSMEVLIARYQAAMKEGISKSQYEFINDMKCLLCNPIDVNKSHGYFYKDGFENACNKLGCPWVVITGMPCDSYDIKKNGARMIYNSDDPKRMKLRIIQLKNWIKIYKTELDKINDKDRI